MMNYMLGLLVSLGVMSKPEPKWVVEQRVDSYEIGLTMIRPVMHPEAPMLSQVEDSDTSFLFNKVMDMCGPNQTLSLQKPKNKRMVASADTKTSDVFAYSCEFKDNDMICKTVISCIPMEKAHEVSGL